MSNPIFSKQSSVGLVEVFLVKPGSFSVEVRLDGNIVGKNFLQPLRNPSEATHYIPGKPPIGFRANEVTEINAALTAARDNDPEASAYYQSEVARDIAIANEAQARYDAEQLQRDMDRDDSRN